jgi:homoserine O-acetyltransferase/O-succinyltransferase
MPLLLALLLAVFPAAAEHDVVLKDFRFASGETLPAVRIHYRTLGKLDGDNAVLLLHAAAGSGAQFMTDQFAGALFAPGQLLDAEKFFLILPDAIGHGKSTKPSDGLHAKFPRYTLDDLVEAQVRLVQQLGVRRLRLVLGTSMGCMETWLWGVKQAETVGALLPLACLPVQVAGRKAMMRSMILDAIRDDPMWMGGDYKEQPRGLATAVDFLLLMGNSPLQLQGQAPTREAADKLLHDMRQRLLARFDANDVLYAVEASRDYDPSPLLGTIQAPVMAVNSADDSIDPPELGILEREITKVPNGKAVVLPITPRTRGHQTHSVPEVWKQYLADLLERSRR